MLLRNLRPADRIKNMLENTSKIETDMARTDADTQVPMPCASIHQSEEDRVKRDACRMNVHENVREPCISLRTDSFTCLAVNYIPLATTRSPKTELVAPARVYRKVRKVGSCSRRSFHVKHSPLCGVVCSKGLMKYGLSPGYNRSWALLLVTVAIASLATTQAMSLRPNFNDMSESPPESRGESSDDQRSVVSFEDTELSAKEFLGKFGYVRPAEWTSVSPRFLGDSGFNLGVTEDDGSQNRENSYAGSGSEDEGYKESHLIRWSFEDISEDQYQRALIIYQRINGLNATGELDNDTRSYMGRPRCGVPDRTAAVKVNRTMEDLEPSTTTTTTVQTTLSINSTSGSWLESISNDSTTAIPTDSTKAIHYITTAVPEDELEGSVESHLLMDGSGDAASPVGMKVSTGDDSQDLSRRRRSLGMMEEKSQVEAGFEDLSFPLEEDNDYPEVEGKPSLVQDLNELRTRRLNFKDLNDAPISEAQLPDESRVASMQDILEALRKEKLSQINATTKDGPNAFTDLINTIRPTPAAPLTGLMKRMIMDSRAKRRKRSSAYLHGKTNGWLMAFPDRVITWRLVEEWPTKRSFMISSEIWFTIKLAFRMWSEILPRNFREDNTSPASNVDILIGFGTGQHNRCRIPFYDGPLTIEYAHAWPLPNAEVHFNDAQPFVSVSWEPSRDVGFSRQLSPYGKPISLLKVATHEIGHTLGLPHKKDRSSVMNPVYIPYQTNNVVELETVDRRAIQSVYGACNMAFDAVFDWVRQDIGPDGALRWKYNTFFFRKTWFWLYENRGRRPKYGDPKYIFNFWRDVLPGPSDPHRKIDGVVHIRDWSIPNGPIYFFTGDTYSEYDSIMDRVKPKDSAGNTYPRAIRDGFPGIPYPIDTVVYKWQESLLYFFKDSYVYKFDWKKGKIVSIATISKTFPGWGGASPLPNNINAAYYSYTDSAYYFFKDIYYWKMADEREKYYNKGLVIPDNAVGPRQLISSKWLYICDVDHTEMEMTLKKPNVAIIQSKSHQ